MRRILVDNARRKRAEKRGGRLEHRRSTTSTSRPRPPPRTSWPSTRRSRLEAKDPVKAQLVKLRYFAGLSEEEAAQALGISRTTAHRHWRYARVWLLNELGGNEEPQENRRKPTGP